MESFEISTGTEGAIGRNTISRLKMILKTLPLLDRDAELKDAAFALGLKDDHVKQLRGLDPYIDMRLAGAEAKRLWRRIGLSSLLSRENPESFSGHDKGYAI